MVGEIVLAELSVSGCARCGENHKNVTAYRLHKPATIDGLLYEFYLICPTNGHPVFVRLFGLAG